MGMCCKKKTLLANLIGEEMYGKVEGSRPRGRPMKAWKEVVLKRLPSTSFEQGGCYGSW